MIGTTLSHYRIVGKLGEGGMGVVYRAEDTKLRRPVALKFISSDLTLDGKSHNTILREARSVSALNHPNICTIYSAEEHEGRPFIVMELLEGESLQQILRERRLTFEDIKSVGTQVADALDAAHSNGIIHRDIKPGNIMVNARGQVKVLDFGLARRASTSEGPDLTASATVTGGIAGTPLYMAPEQLLGQQPDPRTDLYALGLVLYEMATGQRPFQEDLTPKLINAILNHAPAPPHTLNSSIPPELERVILKSLEKDPASRYQSVREIAVDLRRLGITAVPQGTPAVGRRRFLISVLGIALSIAAAVVASFLIWRGGSPVSPGTGGRVSTGGAASKVAEANEYFEKAMLFLVSQMDLARARAMLEKALQLDPGFAEARGWYGFLHVLTLDVGNSNDVGLLYRAEEEIHHTLKDDPNSGRAHSALGIVYFYKGRMELARDEFLLARKLNPADLDADNWMIGYHQLRGSNLAAQDEARKLINRQPLFAPARLNLADLLRERGDKAGALRELDKILETDPHHLLAIVYKARVHMDAGELGDARKALDRARPEDRHGYQFRGATALLQALEGKPDEARLEMDDEVVKYLGINPNQTLVAAEFYSVLGENDRAFEWLERAIRNGDERDEWFGRDPMFKNLRSDPRFVGVLQSIAFRRRQSTR